MSDTGGGRRAWPVGASVDVDVEQHEILVATKLGASDTLRIKFASDFHAGPSTPQKAIDNALEQLARIDADVMLLGGDFVGLRAEHARDLARRLAALPAPLGRFAVLGNHDHWSQGRNRLEMRITEAAIATPLRVCRRASWPRRPHIGCP
jgi:predicted MPP superfamily phosphohydrolase